MFNISFKQISVNVSITFGIPDKGIFGFKFAEEGCFCSFIEVFSSILHINIDFFRKFVTGNCSPAQITLIKIEKSIKVRKDRKTLISVFV